MLSMIEFLFVEEEWTSLNGRNTYAAYYCIIFRKIPRSKQARAVASFSTKFLEKYRGLKVYSDKVTKLDAN